ncbi:SSX2B isoform 3 [Pongo abelii]|uniref:SSX2B isoform 3 n=1 Tax=Pongo abelii TaxID=9601 RepID=A0A2J8R8T4_PONAB|nr:SSX2B isoform 3 [Pongo abelii]
MNGDDTFAKRSTVGAQIPEKIQKAFDGIAKYFSKEEWEKMKASEKIVYVYMKRKYEAMTKLGFKATLPPFMHNKRTADFQGNDFDNDPNCGNEVERPQMTFGRLQGIFPKIMPKKPAEEGNVSKGVPEASGPQNDGKQLCSPGKPTTSGKINTISGPRKGRETRNSSSVEQSEHIQHWSIKFVNFYGCSSWYPKNNYSRDPKGGNMPGPTDCVRESSW